jgi:branched-chain amino acid transport system ATP-binding protein
MPIYRTIPRSFGHISEIDVPVLLEVKNIETYYGPVVAIRGVSLAVEQGRIVTLLGANGAGKTTVLKTISGAMWPQKGTVTLLGREIQSEDPDVVARMGVAHVPEGREVFPFLSVADNLKVGAFSRRDSQVATDLELVYEYFPVLYEKKKLEAGFLSGGEQQMLAIGRAMMQKPQLILLDEPSLGLSPRFVDQIAAIIKRLNDEREVAVLLVEQNARLALEISHFGYVMELGRIVMEDTTDRLRNATDIKEFYLGMKDEGIRGRRRWKQRKTWR